MRKFLLLCLIGVLGTTGCTRDIPVEPAEEWRGSYRLISGTSGGSAIDVADSASGDAPAYHFYGPGIGLWHGGICVQSTACRTANGGCDV